LQYDGISKEEKAKRERFAMNRIKDMLGAQGEVLISLWEDYETGASPEALLMKDLDKLEMILQVRPSDRCVCVIFVLLSHCKEIKHQNPYTPLCRLYSSLVTGRRVRA
jgi:5'-deoxynucleotidase YfbR-like HD superfamily hydrolase